jgi:hypothetical protein
MTIKHNPRARESMAHWADLRSGDMYHGEEDTTRGVGLTVIAVSVAISLAVFCAFIGYALGDVPHVPAETFTNCYSEGC